VSEASLRESLVAAGIALVEEGLVARTWGNLSVRLDERTFLITPSGLAYESLTADDMVAVEYGTLAYEGDRKPSSEKGLHSAVYGLRPDVRAIVHTHQSWASAAAAARCAVPGAAGAPAAAWAPADAGDWGTPCAAYALPTTDALVRSASALLEGTGRSASVRSILLANHGALCFGASLEDAVIEAAALERRSRDFIAGKASPDDSCMKETEIKVGMAPHDLSDPARMIEAMRRYGFLREDWQIAFRDDRLAPSAEQVRARSPGRKVSVGAPEFAGAAKRIFGARKGRSVVLLSTGRFTVRASESGKSIRAYLDDFAQIAGPSIPCADGFSRIRGAALSRPATLVRGIGCLCAADSLYDALAVAMVVEKNCLALAGGTALGGLRSIAVHEALLMRAVYAFKYSRMRK